MKTVKINTVLLILCILLLLGGFFYLDSKQLKVAHVNAIVLYEKFDLKTELEKKLEVVKENRSNILDSLYAQMEVLSIKINNEKNKDQKDIDQFQLLRNNFLKKDQQFTEDNQALAEQYTQEIWNQLNQYVKDYGSENSYAYIFGANGSGSLMSADMGMDITEDVLNYVNKKYQGHKN